MVQSTNKMNAKDLRINLNNLNEYERKKQKIKDRFSHIHILVTTPKVSQDEYQPGRNENRQAAQSQHNDISLQKKASRDVTMMQPGQRARTQENNTRGHRMRRIRQAQQQARQSKNGHSSIVHMSSMNP